MRFFQSILILVVLTSALAAPRSSRAPRSSKSSKSSLEPSESLSIVEADPSDTKDATNRSKKQATICLEIKGTPEKQVECCCPPTKQVQCCASQSSKQVQCCPPQSPPKVPSNPPQLPQQGEQKQTQVIGQSVQDSGCEVQIIFPPPCGPMVSYISVPLIQYPMHVLPHIVFNSKKHGQGPLEPEPLKNWTQTNPQLLPQLNYPQLNPLSPPISQWAYGVQPAPMAIPNGSPGLVICPLDPSSATNALNPASSGSNPQPGAGTSTDTSTPQSRNFMDEQADMMARINAGMDPRMIAGADQRSAGLITPMEYMMRAAHINAMEQAFRNNVQHNHLQHQNQAAQGHAVNCLNGGITTGTGQHHGFTGALNGGSSYAVGSTPQQMAMQANTLYQNPHYAMDLQQNQQTARTWRTRSVEQPKDGSEMSTEASASPVQEVVTPVPSEDSENTKISSSEMINQMRDSAPAQRVARAGNSDANVQMSVIGPGGQSYVVGEPENILDSEMSENRGQELSKREVEASATHSE